MSERKEDGGAAFPWEYESGATYHEDGSVTPHVTKHPGMSLRDWFAGQAVIGCTASTIDYDAEDADETAKRIAIDAYKVADAMLKAKEPSP